MATYWLSASGNDANDGTSYAQAKATLAAGLGLLGTGDTLNVVNDGTHLMLNTSEIVTGQPANIDGDLRCRGTSWTNFGYRIRGTDASGNPALATIAADDTLGDVRVSGIVALRDRPEYGIIEGIKIDWSDIIADATNRYAVGSTNEAGIPIRFNSCVVVGSAYGAAAPAGNRRMFYKISGASYTTETEGIQVYNCVFYNCPNVLTLPETAYQPADIHHNVFFQHTNGAMAFSCLWIGGVNIAGSVEGYVVRHNTFYEISPTATSKMNAKVNIYSESKSDLSVHSNLYYLQPGASVDTASPFGGYLHDNSAVYSGTGTRDDMGYNLFGMGTNFPGLAGMSGANGFYDSIFAVHPSTVVGTEIYGTDNLVTNVTPATLFNGTGAWTWLNSDGYSFDLPIDPRPRLLRQSGLGSTVPGAIPDAISVVTAFPDTYAVTAGNTLSVPAPGVLTNDTITPLDVMYSTLVSNVATGSLSLASDGSFSYTPPLTYSGTVSFTYQAYVGTILSNTTTAVITVDPYPVVDPGVDPPPVIDVIDTAPFFQPTLRVSTEFRIKTTKNRTKYKDLSNYTKEVRWEESTHRVLNLATNTTYQVTLGGVADAEYLMIETDHAIDVSINDNTRYWPVSEVVALALTSATTVYLRNNSVTNTAQVFLVAVD